jgi:hypothetical protein
VLYFVPQEILIENGQTAATLGDVRRQAGMLLAQALRLPPGVALLDINNGGIEQGLEVALTLVMLQGAQGTARLLQRVDQVEPYQMAHACRWLRACGEALEHTKGIT